MRLIEYMQILGTMVSFTSGAPAIYKNVESRHETGLSNPINSLSIFSTGMLVFAGLGRLPNIFRGLITAIKSKNKESIRRFTLISLGSTFVTVTFYITLVLMALYKQETTEKEREDKKIAQILATIFTLAFVSAIAYLINGLSKI